ncbi:long-chain fatty acid--CoA ligase [Bdellovibrionota bacterium FG-2]
MPTVLHRLSQWAEATPQAPAQRFKRNGVWETITAQEFRDRVYHLALFFEAHGMTAKDVSCILSPNNPQWVHTDLAALLMGAKSTGLYPNSTSKDIGYILNHTETRFLAVKDKEFFNKIDREKKDATVLDRLKMILVFDGDTSISPKAVAYEAALAEGRKIASTKAGKSFIEYLSKVDPNAPAFMIYTSGTTGNPKGALLSHDNLAYTVDIAVKYWGMPFARGVMFSFLPLCHIAERLQNVGVGLSQRYCVSFCTKFDNVSMELPEVQPTLLLCVPRLWEKMMEGVMAKVETGKGPKKKLALWALDVGKRVAEAKYSGRRPKVIDFLQLKIADRLVLSKVRSALGLGQAEMIASGAAALPAHVSRWFRSLQLEILEDFGQTETTGVICMTEVGVESAGTVGRAIPGVEMKIAEDGELLTRGRHVFKGYFKDDEATQQALEGGWLHTGDLGELNEKGLVRIRGRKKEVLKTSGGKMIAPLPIEEQLKVATVISQVCIVGDGRKYLAALVTLSETTVKELKEKGTLKDSMRVVSDPSIVGQVQTRFNEVNSGLASFEQIKKFAVLANEFSIVDGEMTPTLKMKRNVIESRYRDLIDQMYT